MKKIIAACAAALSLLSAPVLAEDSPTAYLWINFVKAAPGQGEALTKLMIQEDSKTFDPLVDGGQAFDWGVAQPIIHDGNDAYSHVEWVTFKGWAGADAFMAKYRELQSKMSAKDSAALEAKFAALVVPGSHADLVLRGVHAGKGAGGGGMYINLGYYKANPGKAGETERFYEENIAPVYDKLVASGAIINYGLMTPEIHRGQPWTYMGWSETKNLASRDAIDAAFDAADAARSPEEKKAFGEKVRELLDFSGHSDQILIVVHQKFAGGN
jgi:putative intracellular protease/amidase